MDELQIEHTGILSAHEQRIMQLERRMGCVEQMQGSLADMATGIAVLAEKVSVISNDTGDIKTRLDIIEERPAANWRQLLWIVATALVGVGVGYFVR